MEKSTIKNRIKKVKRAQRVRSKFFGTAVKPRMSVIKSNKHIQVQLIDDAHGTTLACVSTHSKEMRNSPFAKKNKESAKVIGEKIAEKAKSLGIEQVIFDRGPFAYHGILAELAQAARNAGLQF